MAKMIPLHSASSLCEIERRARELFEREGHSEGRDLDHWLQAETEFNQSHQPAGRITLPPATRGTSARSAS